MNVQINVRMPEKLLVSAKGYAQAHGFGSLQELVRESIREMVCDDEEMSKKEYELIKKLIEVSRKHNLYATEEELFKKLNERKKS